MRPHVPVYALATLVLVLVAGCARSAEERQLDAMRADIDRIQQERDQEDRSSLPPETAEAPSAGSVETSSAPVPSPMADVVHVGVSADDSPADYPDYADPDDTAPRPRIRVLGSPRVNGRDIEQVDDASPGVARSPSLDPEAKRAYDAALTLVAAKKYEPALDLLAAFLVKWPEHPYADHAMFWRGECYFAGGDYARASEQFEGVLARFPAGSKVPDSLLKLGMSQEKLGNSAKARDCFQRLAKEFPQSDAARRIPVGAAGSSR
jgi:tol-pal system protein YbgF